MQDNEVTFTLTAMGREHQQQQSSLTWPGELSPRVKSYLDRLRVKVRPARLHAEDHEAPDAMAFVFPGRLDSIIVSSPAAAAVAEQFCLVGHRYDIDANDLWTMLCLGVN